MTEIYVSTDIEADGPIPGPHSMLSFASAALRADKTLVGTFSANLRRFPGPSREPQTMACWQSSPKPGRPAGRRAGNRPSHAGVRRLAEGLPGKPVFVAYPAAFDFMFVYWYLIRFAGESPFSHSALDIKTYAMALLGLPYRDAVKRNMPKVGSTPGRIRTSPWTMPSGRALFRNMLQARQNLLGKPQAPR